MVEVIGKSEEEIKLRDKVKSLEEITKEFIKKSEFHRRFFTISSSPAIIFLRPVGGTQSIDVFCGGSIIELPYKKLYDFTYKLAERYEKVTGDKWTLKKTYFD